MPGKVKKRCKAEKTMGNPGLELPWMVPNCKPDRTPYVSGIFHTQILTDTTTLPPPPPPKKKTHRRGGLVSDEPSLEQIYPQKKEKERGLHFFRREVAQVSLGLSPELLLERKRNDSGSYVSAQILRLVSNCSEATMLRPVPLNLAT